MPTPAQVERRSIVRMGDLANMSSALCVWREIDEWNPELSVRGLAPLLNAYRRFVYEPNSNGLLATNRMLDVRRYTSGSPLAIHVVGSTGVGKDAVLEAMNIPWVLSDTERPCEPRDVPGKTYNFVTRHEMDESVRQKNLIDLTRVQYRDHNSYRYGIHRRRVLAMIESGTPVFAFRTNQDGFTPISNFCEMNGIPVVRVFILPNTSSVSHRFMAEKNVWRSLATTNRWDRLL